MSKLAICIASYNCGKFLPDLFKSLKKQTFKDFKVYIVYDGSTDNTLKVIKKYQKELPITIVGYKPTARVGLNKNRVIKRALRDAPKYIQMIDADDKVLPRFLEAGVKRLDKGDVDWVLTWGKLFGGRKGHIHGEVDSLPFLLRNNRKQHSWGLFKREIFEKHNFKKSLSAAVDWALWIEVAKSGYKGAIVKEELYLKRWHDESVTATVKKSQREKRIEVLTATGFKNKIGKFRFHLLGLAHLPISEEYMGCAFTQKILKLSKMLLSLGHEVYLYGSEGSDAPCTKFIQTHTLKDIRDAWGEGDNRFEIGYDWREKGFKHDFNETRTPTTFKFYESCIKEINAVKEDDDFLLIMQGTYHRPIGNSINLYLTCEPGIGYRGSYCRFRAFESAYIQNFTYGSEHPRKSINGNYYDRVIPNYFDPKNFEFSEEKEDYYLYIGRMIHRKGVYTAVKACEAIGAKLKMAGQDSLKIGYDKAEFLGYVDVEQRKPLMAKAKAVFVPTIYLEPFAGTHVEAMLSGTPVITTNFGVFPSTFTHGVHGFRCDTLQDFVEAAKKVEKLNPKVIRKFAERYLMDNVKWEFEKWFRDLYQLYLSAKDPSVKGWHYLKS